MKSGASSACNDHAIFEVFASISRYSHDRIPQATHDWQPCRDAEWINAQLSLWLVAKES
jgi:hypothetical protein